MLLFVQPILIAQVNTNDKLNGIWVSEKKDLKVKVYSINNIVYAKLVWFPCNHTIKKPMSEHKDALNSNKLLRNRSWLDIVILNGLVYDGKDKWVNGSIYDPHTGKTWSASVTLRSNNILEVRGYWGIELFGKTIIFNRELINTKK